MLLAAVVAGGTYLRVASVGLLSPWSDELPHLIAARSLVAGEGLALPSDGEYRRAAAHTLLVAGSMRLGGRSEGAARLPSALLGSATLLLVWWIVRGPFGDGAGLASAALLSVMPLHVAHSRSARFYVGFVLAYGAAAVLGSRALRTRSLRWGICAAAVLAVALHLQAVALTVLLPLLVEGIVTAFRASTSGTLARRRLIAGAILAGIAGIIVVGVPSIRSELPGVLTNPVPGIELDPGPRLGYLWRVLAMVSWWAWLPLVLPAVFALRRAGSDGLTPAVHLLVPAVALSVLFRPAGGGSIPLRYAIQLGPFVAVVAGIGAAEVGRFIAEKLHFVRVRVRVRVREAVALGVAAAAGVVSASGFTGAIGMPREPHPGRVIPRPNWNAAAALVRGAGAPGDALLSTGPLAMAWTLGRCGDWLRSREAAAPFMRGDRDVYCGSALIGDASAFRAYVAEHPRGWIIADPTSWTRQIDGGTRLAVESLADEVTVDPSVLVYRWGR